MPKLSHEEIVGKFLDSRSVDFDAIGKFVAENGAHIAASGRGDYGVRFGYYNILACFWIGPIDRTSPLGNLASSGIASDVTGS